MSLKNEKAWERWMKKKLRQLDESGIPEPIHSLILGRLWLKGNEKFKL